MMSAQSDLTMHELSRSRRLVLPELLARSAAKRPDRIALVFEGREVSFAGLRERARRLAGALLQRGVGSGDRVAVLMYNRLEYIEALFACWQIGAVAVPVNFRLVESEIEYVLSDSGAIAAISDEPLAGRTATAVEGLPASGTHLAIGEPPPGAERYEQALKAAEEAAPAPIAEDDLALIMYTSGTTGRPKGAMLSHLNLVANTINWVHEMGARDGDVWLSGLPLFHIGGLNGVLPFIYLASTGVITPSTRFDAQESIELLCRHRVSMCFFVPTQWHEICTRAEVAMLAQASLKVAMWGASPAPLPILQLMNKTMPGVAVVSAFGQTEMSSNTAFMQGEDAIRKIGSVGRPAINVEVRIVDEQGADVPQGEVGEIVYRGPTVMRGYLGNEQATAEAFAGGWFHSGDLVREDEDGFLYVVGRKKDMIVSGGENIYPAEVEAALIEHEAVEEVAVIGCADPRWVEAPLAVVVLRDGARASEEQLIEHCKGLLASYKKPARVIFADALPRNASGKVLKRELREQFGQIASEVER